MFVVKRRIDLAYVRRLIEDTAGDAVVIAVFFTAFFAQTAEFTYFKLKRFGTSSALIADPALAYAAFGAVIAVILALAVVFIALAAYLAVFPTLFAQMTAFAVFDPCRFGTRSAVFADVLTAVDAVLAFIGALTDLGVTGAAVGAVIAVVYRAFFADAAVLADINAFAERAFGTFRAQVCLVAFGAVFSAVAYVVIAFNSFGLKLVPYRIDFAVRTQYQTFGFAQIQTFLTHKSL